TKLVQTPLEQKFIAQSLAQRASEEQAELERKARETRLEQRSRTFLYGLVAVFAVATLIAGGLSILAFSLNNQSQRNAAEFRSISLSFGAQDADDYWQPAVALALSAESVTLDNPPLHAITTFNQISKSNRMRQRFVG